MDKEIHQGWRCLQAGKGKLQPAVDLQVMGAPKPLAEPRMWAGARWGLGQEGPRHHTVESGLRPGLGESLSPEPVEEDTRFSLSIHY